MKPLEKVNESVNGSILEHFLVKHQGLSRVKKNNSKELRKKVYFANNIGHHLYSGFPIFISLFLIAALTRIYFLK